MMVIKNLRKKSLDILDIIARESPVAVVTGTVNHNVPD